MKSNYKHLNEVWAKLLMVELNISPHECRRHEWHLCEGEFVSWILKHVFVFVD